jgi:hypothetical protein
MYNIQENRENMVKMYATIHCSLLARVKDFQQCVQTLPPPPEPLVHLLKSHSQVNPASLRAAAPATLKGLMHGTF